MPKRSAGASDLSSSSPSIGGACSPGRAGFPTPVRKPSVPPGANTSSSRAASAPTLRKRWTVPRGTRTESPVPAGNVRSPSSISSRPERMWKASSSRVRTCGGGPFPGVTEPSANVGPPPEVLAVDLTVRVSPTAWRDSPSPAGTCRTPWVVDDAEKRGGRGRADHLFGLSTLRFHDTPARVPVRRMTTWRRPQDCEVLVGSLHTRGGPHAADRPDRCSRPRAGGHACVVRAARGGPRWARGVAKATLVAGEPLRSGRSNGRTGSGDD